jgi:hypothetical protein
MSSWTETMPAALCTAKWKSAPASSSPATVLAGAPAWASSTQRAATSATTSASACCSPVSGPGTSRYKLSAPRCTAPTRSGNPNTARTPACSAGGVKAGHRRSAGSPRSGSVTTLPCWQASRHGPSPRVYCSSSISWLTWSVVHNDPRGMSPDISMTAAPLTPTICGPAWHSRPDDHPSPRPTAPPGPGATCHQPLGTTAPGQDPGTRAAASWQQLTCRLLRLRKKAPAGTGRRAVPGRATRRFLATHVTLPAG